jgi:hypothetical protein
MDNKMLITNCPNCGGDLLESGNCPYCGTKVRYENEISVNTDEFGTPERVEILIKRQHGDTVYITPFVGYLESISYDTVFDINAIYYKATGTPIQRVLNDCKLSFVGHIYNPNNK